MAVETNITADPISFTVRVASPSEAAEIASLGARVFYESFAYSMPAEDMDKYLRTSYDASVIQTEIEDTHTYHFYVARDNHSNKLLGFVQLNRRSDEPCLKVKPPQTIELQRIYTDSKAHGRGVGSKLLTTAINYAIAQGHKAMWLGVWEHNPKAYNFYQRNHFTKVGDHDFTIGSCVQTDWILERRF